MQDFQKYSINKLELNVILDKLESIAIIPNVKNKIKSLEASNDIKFLEEELLHVDECLRITSRLERAPIYISSDYSSIINLSFKGAILSALELYETVRLYQTIKALTKQVTYLQKEQIESVYYQSKIANLYINNSLDTLLIKSIDENGYVLDSASSTLNSIRKKINHIDIQIKQRLQELIAKEGSKLSQSSVVLRDDRFCLAVKSEYKNQFKGILHDTSASMQTCFIEPLVVSQLMSDKAKLYEEEKIEINRIIKELSLEVATEAYNLKESFEIICEIDFLFAKAILAMSYDGVKPKLNTEGTLELVMARHPLLKVKKVIPNSVSFGNYLGIIITGPNTGGKTVLLKTIGLLCLMVKYGLLIPADETSNIMLFDQVLCDIGDDQSIESNLSTFSSHMTNITQIINHVTPKSLVLFDEIGSGTDPMEGSNLAKAILKYLIKERVSFATTTHYSALKAFAFDNHDVINASMEFNQDTLTPTYRLNLGISGSSNAFNIAKRLGLKNEIIQDAKKMTQTENDDTRQLIFKLEKQSKELDAEKEQILSLKKSLDEEKKLYNDKKRNLDNQKNAILQKARREADEFVDKISKEALDVLEKAQSLNVANTKLHEIIDAKHQVNTLSKNIVKEKKEKPKTGRKPIVGDDVYISSYDQYGVIQKVLKDGRYEVSIGNMSLSLDLTMIEVVPKKEILGKEKNSISYSSQRSSISLRLDLRGKRYEEARELIDKYIDDLVVANIKQATIIHGFGTGVIRELVRNYLKNNKLIASYRYGGENEGGLGVTVITLK